MPRKRFMFPLDSAPCSMYWIAGRLAALATVGLTEAPASLSVAGAGRCATACRSARGCRRSGRPLELKSGRPGFTARCAGRRSFLPYMRTLRPSVRRLTVTEVGDGRDAVAHLHTVAARHARSEAAAGRQFINEGAPRARREDQHRAIGVLAVTDGNDCGDAVAYLNAVAALLVAVAALPPSGAAHLDAVAARLVAVAALAPADAVHVNSLMNAAQVLAGKTSAGPSGRLLSRTGTTPGMPSATSTQSPPAWLL